MAKPQRPPRTLTVQRKSQVTPHMLRITFTGSDLADFPPGMESGYLKFRLREPDPASGEKPMLRTYTVRRFDPESLELDVDFVMHATDGPAATWAASCRTGDTIRAMGPGPTKLVDHDADWFLLVGDMSALPAISANLERLPADARGYALLEIIHGDDKQDLDVPPGIEIRWLLNAHPEAPNTVLTDAVQSLPWLPGEPSIWVAGELQQSLTIRSFLREKHAIARKQMYASSYWQIGHSEDGHRINKAKVAED